MVSNGFAYKIVVNLLDRWLKYISVILIKVRLKLMADGLVCSIITLLLLYVEIFSFRTKTVCALLVPPVPVTCRTHHILIVIVLVIFGEEYRSVMKQFPPAISSSRWPNYSPQPPCSQTVSSSYFFLSLAQLFSSATLFSNTPNPFSFLQRATTNFTPSFLSSVFPNVHQSPKFCVSFRTL
jgi:hypothetical protein